MSIISEPRATKVLELYKSLTPLQPVGLQDDRCQRITLYFGGCWIERYDHPLALLFCPPAITKIAGQPIFCTSKICLARASLTNLYCHIEFAKGMLGVFIEVAWAKQMTTARFYIVSCHPPRWSCRF